LLVFRLHQYLSFGGTFGEYYLIGLLPYLRTLAIFLAGTCMDCILWAGSWRVLGEAFAFAGTWLAPQRHAAIRRWVEVACSIAYYGGISAMIVYAFVR
jgi:hypothetical protein